jgi:hypothetical protein
MSGSQLAALAQVSQAEAEKTAVAKIGGKENVSVAAAELESEHGSAHRCGQRQRALGQARNLTMQPERKPRAGLRSA